MKQTVVEWLIDEIDMQYPDINIKRKEWMIDKAKEMEGEQMKEMEFLKFQRDVYIQDIEILKARLREAEQNKN